MVFIKNGRELRLKEKSFLLNWSEYIDDANLLIPKKIDSKIKKNVLLILLDCLSVVKNTKIICQFKVGFSKNVKGIGFIIYL